MTETMTTQEHIRGALLAVRRAAPEILARLQRGLSQPPLELIYTSHPRWPLPPLPSNNATRDLRVSILDSSFNPPTKAHLALACYSRPAEWASSEDQKISEEYDANLLLLSVKNVDKSLKAGDATYVQRLEMMTLLAHRIPSVTFDGPIPEEAEPKPVTSNVAIAVTDQPTFVGKSSVLSQFLTERLSTLGEGPETSRPELTFLLGLDTLERLFSLRYYPSDSAMACSLRKFLSPYPGDNCRIVSANRVFISSIPSPEDWAIESRSLREDLEKSGRIATINLDQQLSTYSSSAVRESLAKGDLSSSGNESLIWKDLVTSEVARYIQEHRLYTSQ
ncbi:hypothetical protein CPB83DRAFT_846849 [Crepidotus variabilis]|uniref:Nicotinamide-nucleotide adenylyltransferase n=1 Tax=Crepidotus variabilis TaxID=179855 RepID=A0A9P6JU10_9AGAR|nr:hypothetical protein CPB83DRAFT_846849 [Crepidotus variabilis]